MIYIANSNWFPTEINPFSQDGTYGDNWSAFIYDPTISYFTNVYPHTKLHVLRFHPDSDKDFLRLFDFLHYELSYKRNIILKGCIGIDMHYLLEQFHKSSYKVTYRPSDEKYMVHSTTLSAWESIKKEKALLSPNKLKKLNKSIEEIGLKPMLEPKDYSDYIMLDILEGCGELVVNSHNLGLVCTDPNIEYTPGIRLYFDVETLFMDGLVTRDGLHLVKIKDRLPLEKYLIASISSKDFSSTIKWTPTLFTQKANELFLANHEK